jgi:phosphatidylserine/phosphatidylglycerophosphate/cardiolipin synthase-like enzyme
MFWIATSLVISVLTPVSSAASVASGAAIAVCFAPDEDYAAFVVRAIDNAEREILVGAYGLTTGSSIVEALIRAKQRGVDVRLIADQAALRRWASGNSAWAHVGVPIWIDDQPRIAHAKTMVIDGSVTLMGVSLAGARSHRLRCLACAVLGLRGRAEPSTAAHE